MSRSAFLTTNELPTTTDLRFVHGLIPTNRSNETLPMVVQSLSTKTGNKSIVQKNLRLKRNLRDKRRATGIRPDEISLASTSTEGSANDDDEEDNKSTYITEPIESFDHNRNMPSKPVFTVTRIQSSFDNLSIPRTEPYITTPSSSSSPSLSTMYSSSTSKIFRPEEFILRRVEKQTSDDDSSMIKYRQLEERILALESLLHDKDSIIYDLQRKLDNITRDLTDAEQQIYILRQDKLTLIKAFSSLQDDKSSSGDRSICSNFVKRN